MAAPPAAVPSTTGSCTTLPLSDASYRLCATALQRGGLVAFPTETVYGLGANALDDAAVRSIFTAKGRPLSDPVIIHVAGVAEAQRLTVLDAGQRNVFELLTSQFWPGPLTLVVPAAACVPKSTTAGGEWVGLRAPSHPVARQLLHVSQVAIAAPSANRFGHVSPTLARHVADDLAGQERAVLILDGGACVCEHGIESTVAKIERGGKAVSVLRRGAVPESALHACLATLSPPVAVAAVCVHKSPEDTSQESPGQLLTHYAPDVAAYVVSRLPSVEPSAAGLAAFLPAAVVLDFHGGLLGLAPQALAYRDLSADGCVAEAAANLFSALRWAELVAGAKIILLPDLSTHASTHAPAVADRIYRASSGRTAKLAPNNEVLLDA